MIRTVRAFLLLAVLLLAGARPGWAQHPWSDLSPEMQIRLAVQAAPEEARDAAIVQGYDARGNFVTLREGTGTLVCMAPTPDREEFEVSCHHVGLEPYFARGRELLAQGITGNARTQARWDEYTEGKLPIPYGATNYILTGSGFDPATAEITDAFLRWVVYTPMATPESTGLSARPGEIVPWLMFPGTPGSHIMIVPPRGGGE
ncbi:MAG TPA: hypothetical protein VLA43_18090 [Longimicrobiales bacterium]|nr:hypothetical protein [Longimicrobiales bacterium]